MGCEKNPPRRGIEPRPPAWQAGILTTILSRIWLIHFLIALYYLIEEFMGQKNENNILCLILCVKNRYIDEFLDTSWIWALLACSMKKSAITKVFPKKCYWQGEYMVNALSEQTTSDPFGKRHKQGHVAVFVSCGQLVPGQRIFTHQSWINRSFLHQLLLLHPKWRRFPRTSPIVFKIPSQLNLFLITTSSHFY